MKARTRRDSTEPLNLVPLGIEGLDYQSNQALALPRSLVVGEGVRLGRGSLDQRKGSPKLYRATALGASKTFGATTKYATITAATQLQIPKGGFAAFLHFTAAWSGAGKTGYVLSSRVNGQSYHVLQCTISDAGVVTVTWEKTSGGACTVATTALTDDSEANLLALFDAVAGTFTVYVNGDANGTPVTGLSATETPIAGASTDWHLGAHYDPAVAGVVANTNFDGLLDGFTLISLKGMRPASGSTTLASVLRNHSLRQWPTPQMDGVLCHYDFNHTSTTVLYDSSRHKNDGALSGTPSNTAAVCRSSDPTNFCGHVQRPDGSAANILGIAGSLYYEATRGAT